MNLKAWKDVEREALPSCISAATHSMFWILLVKGAAIEASASLKEIPQSAVFRAPQSFAPSPHIPIFYFKKWFWRLETSRDLSSGDILAKT
jgi:hypothetical protein